MTFPSEHFGATKRRKWFKVRWNEKANKDLIGKIDLLSEDILPRQKSYVEVLETVETDTCAGGTPLGFGKWSQERIEEWIKLNRKF